MRRTGNLTITDLPLDGGADTNYAVLASTKGYHGAGYFPVKASSGKITRIELMILPKKRQLNFHEATWKQLLKNQPTLAEFFRNSLRPRSDVAKAYGELLEDNSIALACFLNIWEIFGDIRLAAGDPRDYVHGALAMDKTTFCGDRFFTWCRREFLDQVEAASDEPTRVFSPVPPPSAFHPGATRGNKEIAHGQAISRSASTKTTVTQRIRKIL